MYIHTYIYCRHILFPNCLLGCSPQQKPRMGNLTVGFRTSVALGMERVCMDLRGSITVEKAWDRLGTMGMCTSGTCHLQPMVSHFLCQNRTLQIINCPICYHPESLHRHGKPTICRSSPSESRAWLTSIQGDFERYWTAAVGRWGWIPVWWLMIIGLFFLLWNRLSNESPGKFDVVVLNYQFDLKCDVNLWNWSLPKLDIQKSILGRRKLLPPLLQQAWLSGRENTCYASAFAWLVGWFVGSTSAINPWNFGVKRPREISEPTGSISFHCLNWTLSMCLPGAVNTAEVEKVGTELRALKEKLKQEAQGKWDALQAQFFDPITLSSGFRYIYIY